MLFIDEGGIWDEFLIEWSIGAPYRVGDMATGK